jgi:hypothetical protein
MNVIDFGQEGCKKAAKLLDAFLNNELSAESSQSIAEHVEGCPDCSREVEERTELRNRVRKALGSQQSSAVQARLRSRLREESERYSFRAWAVPLAVAATLLIGVFSVWEIGFGSREAWRTSIEEQEAYVDSLYTQVASVMQSGLGDHIHCTHYRRFPVEKSGVPLGEEYEELSPWIREIVQDDFHVLLEHQCKYRNRQYVHFALGREDERLSVILTRKQEGESFGRDQLVPALQAAGVPIYSADADQFEIAGFETDEYLAFVVSNLPREDNLRIAQALTPELQVFLQRKSG